MKNIIYSILAYTATIQIALAEWDGWILWDFAESRDWGNTSTTNALRTWDIHIDDIPVMIQWAINFFMGIAWTVAIIFIIIWAYKILFGSLEQDKTKWKDTIIMAIGWFALASLAWFIIKMIIDNLS